MLLSLPKRFHPTIGPIGFYLTSVKPMKSSWHRSRETIFGSLVLESYGILVSELDGIQCNVVADSPVRTRTGRKRLVPMKFPSFHGSSIRMNGSSDRIYSISAGIDRNLPQPTTIYGHRFIALGSYHFPTRFLPDTARFLAVFTGNAWEYCCQKTLTWVYWCCKRVVSAEIIR